MRVLSITFGALFLISASMAIADEVTLTQDEADTLQLILKKDNLMNELVKSQHGLEGLGRVLGMTITGPVKLAVQWNQAAIEGWRKVNANLVKVEQAAVCKDIALQIAGGDAQRVVLPAAIARTGMRRLTSLSRRKGSLK
jgi:hypothetical protein